MHSGYTLNFKKKNNNHKFREGKTKKKKKSADYQKKTKAPKLKTKKSIMK
jgi:hypothetical protein